MKRSLRGIGVVVGVGLFVAFGLVVVSGAAPPPFLSAVVQNNANPTLHDGQSTGNGAVFSYDLGVNEGQIGLVFGYSIAWNEYELGKLELTASGNVTGGGCALVVLAPNFYRDLRILSGRYEIYNLPGINDEFHIKKLVMERAREQNEHYGCQYQYKDVSLWGNPAPSVAATATITTTISPTAVLTECERRVTGKGDKTLSFEKGEVVVGWRIVLKDDSVCFDENNEGKCWLNPAPMAGTVTDGVVCPDPGEIPDGDPWDPNS